MVEITVGIYQILFISENISYIGQSINVEKRLKDHLNSFKTDKEYVDKYGINERLYNFWNKYGEENFEFNILEKCTKDKLNEREKYWLDFYGGYLSNKTFNLQDAGDYQPLSKESCEKISKKLKGKKPSEEHKIKISNSKKGIRTSIGFTGKNHTEESRKAISEKMSGENNPFYGKKHTKETLLKMSKPRKLTKIKNKEKFIKNYKIIIDNPNMTQMQLYDKYHIDRHFTSEVRNGTHWIINEINKEGRDNH